MGGSIFMGTGRRYNPYYLTAKKEFQALRLLANQTPHEILLWNRIKSRQLGVTFVQQKVICGYIVDFYSAKYHLAIELDGRLHDPEKDKRRDLVLNQVGVYVLRFKNYQLDENIEAVLIRIKAQIEKSKQYTERKKLTKRIKSEKRNLPIKYQ